MTEFIISLVSIAIGVFLGQYLSKLKFEKSTSTLEERQRLSDQQKKELENKLLNASNEQEELRKEKEFLVIENTKKTSELENLKVKLSDNKQEIEKLQEKFTKEFENLANKILDEKSTKFTAQNKENMQTILNPLQEKIKLFEDKVDKTHKESIDYHAALRQQILGLKEMNLQMSKETINLTKALKGDSKAQGNWGELVLKEFWKNLD